MEKLVSVGEEKCRGNKWEEKVVRLSNMESQMSSVKFQSRVSRGLLIRIAAICSEGERKRTSFFSLSIIYREREEERSSKTGPWWWSIFKK